MSVFTEDQIQQLAQELQGHGGRVLVVPTDVTDRQAVEAMARTGKPLISTSGLLGLAPGQVTTEAMAASGHSPRRSEDVLKAAERGVRAMTIRLPPNTHDGANGGFAPMIIAAAQAKGVSAYIGEGKNRWPAVHRSDAAKLYRLALEKGVAGARYHAAMISCADSVES